MTIDLALEGACSQIKHSPDTVDLDDMRDLLRRAQTRIRDLEEITRNALVRGIDVLALLNQLDVS